MGAIYTLSRSNTALSTTADWLTLISAATRSLRIREIGFGGMATASAANEVGIARVSVAGTTGGGALTAVPLNPNAAAAGFTNFTTWSAQPTLGNVILRLPLNANGGVFRWVAPPGMEIEVPGGNNAAGSISIRSIVGTSNVTGYVVVEEL